MVELDAILAVDVVSGDKKEKLDAPSQAPAVAPIDIATTENASVTRARRASNTNNLPESMSTAPSRIANMCLAQVSLTIPVTRPP